MTLTLSREAHPKPFMQLPDGENLIRKTFRRATALQNVSEVMTVTNRDLLFKTEDEYKLVNSPLIEQSFILEPFGRNTAAAVAAAALQTEQTHGENAQILVLAADHLIKDEPAFAKAVKEAQKIAADGWLVTFGVEPEAPETGFGYIDTDLSTSLGAGYKVNRFIEKPDLTTATEYIKAGNYLWNSGMFCFCVSTLLHELEQHCPELLHGVRKTLLVSRLSEGYKHRTLTLDADAFSHVPDISIDYALMERSSNVATVPCSIGWSDIGSWNTLSEMTEVDEDGNRFDGEVLSWQSTGSYVNSPDRLVALVGVASRMII